MIKKNTKAIFLDGDFQGEYDWQGGIPLSEGEVMQVQLNGKMLNYRVTKKETVCIAEEVDQTINIVYTLESIQ